jgi:histidinol-phosphatase (PHP family)
MARVGRVGTWPTGAADPRALVLPSCAQTETMALPADGHVHSQWSWDADLGSMDATCAQAVRMGLPAIAFTDHVDFTPFRAGFLEQKFRDLVADGILTATELDVQGYQESIERCRAHYPDLRILTGIEVGQPHRHPDRLAAVLSTGAFDRVIGSLHCLPDGDAFAEPWQLFLQHPAPAVFRDYLAEIPRMVAAAETLEVFGHIDYPVRFWPADTEPFEPADFEGELRQALQAIAAAGLALEINTRVPLDPRILAWFREEGGRRLTFGSDAHLASALGAGLVEAARMAEAHHFRPDTRPEDPWIVGR